MPAKLQTRCPIFTLKTNNNTNHTTSTSTQTNQIIIRNTPNPPTTMTERINLNEILLIKELKEQILSKPTYTTPIPQHQSP